MPNTPYVNGTLVIIDGEPGTGKTLQAVRMMLKNWDLVDRHICTNVAILPPFFTEADKFRRGLRVLKPTDAEITHFWNYVPRGLDVYIDEAHLIWSSTFWTQTRTRQLMSYLSQYRKQGDSLYLMTQNFGNLELFIRQRSSLLYSCRCMKIPKGILFNAWPLQNIPLLFAVNVWTVEGGERHLRVGWPRFYFPFFCKRLYECYDTTAQVQIPDSENKGEFQLNRPEWSEVPMPDVLTSQLPSSGGSPAAGSPAAPAGITIVNNPPSVTPKRWRKTKLFILLLIALFVTEPLWKKYANTSPEPQKSVIPVPQQLQQEHQITWYGLFDHSVIIKQDGRYGLWHLQTTQNGWQLLSADDTGVTLVDPNGLYAFRAWFTPAADHSSTGTASKSAGSFLGH